jgi:ankyrin repeat protein
MEAAQLLLGRGAPIDQPDGHRGNTALMGVAFKGYLPIAEMLLVSGANPHSVNRAGQSALMFASLSSRADIVDRLIALGANPEMQDAAGNSALSIALSQGNVGMATRLGHEP